MAKLDDALKEQQVFLIMDHLKFDYSLTYFLSGTEEGSGSFVESVTDPRFSR